MLKFTMGECLAMDETLLYEFMRNPESPFMRFTVDQVTQMVEAGIFKDDERYELLNGYLVLKDTADTDRNYTARQARYHAVVDCLCNRLAAILAGSELVVKCNSPVRLNSSSTFTPQLTIVRGRCRDFTREYPGPDLIQLVVEIEVSFGARGRRIEKDNYARAAIPNYWLIDLRDSHLEVYQSPDRERGVYTKCLSLKDNETVHLHLPDVGTISFSVNEMLNACLRTE